MNAIGRKGRAIYRRRRGLGAITLTETGTRTRISTQPLRSIPIGTSPTAPTCSTFLGESQIVKDGACAWEWYVPKAAIAAIAALFALPMILKRRR